MAERKCNRCAVAETSKFAEFQSRSGGAAFPWEGTTEDGTTD